MSSLPPDYYAILEISPTATQEQIKTAYKKAALKWHPDRVPADDASRGDRTRRFQRINDAYYTLSDASRRRDYDEARRFGQTSHETFDSEEQEHAGAGHAGGAGKTSSGGAQGGSYMPNMFGAFPWNWFFGSKEKPSDSQEEKFAQEQFGSVFEEMMQDEGLADGERRPTKRFWSILGAVSGGTLGFITANFLGAVTGAVAGERLGRIRDARGKSVLEVYKELDSGSKAKLLSELAAKVFAGITST